MYFLFFLNESIQQVYIEKRCNKGEYEMRTLNDTNNLETQLKILNYLEQKKLEELKELFSDDRESGIDPTICYVTFR